MLIGLFLFGILAQAVTGILMHHRGPGWTPATITAHYRGRTVDFATLPPQDVERAMAGDPRFLDRPAKTWDALLDVAHMHLAFMPMIVFIVAHLFSMAPFAKRAWAGCLCYATGIAALVDIATPFLIRLGWPGFATVKLLAFIVLECGLIAMTVTVLAACYFRLRQAVPPNSET